MGFGLQSLNLLFPRIPVHPFQHPRSSKSLQHTSTIFSQHHDRKASGATVTSSSPCAKSRWDSWAFRLSVGSLDCLGPGIGRFMTGCIGCMFIDILLYRQGVARVLQGDWASYWYDSWSDMKIINRQAIGFFLAVRVGRRQKWSDL